MKKDNKIQFVSLAEFLTQERVESAQGKGTNPVNYLFGVAKSDYLAANGEKYLLELSYYKWNLFVWSLLASLIAMILFVVIKNKIPGTIFTVTSIVLQITAMVIRVMISGRAPVTNMYETVMFSGFGALIISCIIFAMRKEIMFVLAGLAFNVLGLMMMKFANGLNAFFGDDIPNDMKDIYLFLGGVNAIVATYSYFNKTDYEEYYLQHKDTAPKVGFFVLPDGTGISVTKSF